MNRPTLTKTETDVLAERPTRGETCDSCCHDRGRSCGVVSRDTDGTDPKARATRVWARRWCDDETMRPLTGADGCPGFERLDRAGGE